jgi:hypothetical protein
MDTTTEYKLKTYTYRNIRYYIPKRESKNHYYLSHPVDEPRERHDWTCGSRTISVCHEDTRKLIDDAYIKMENFSIPWLNHYSQSLSSGNTWERIVARTILEKVVNDKNN